MRQGTRRPLARLLLGVVVALVLAGAAAGLAACGSSGSAATTPSPNTGADVLGTVDSYMAAWNAHDPATAATYLASNATFLDMTIGTPVAGRSAIQKGVIAYFINACPDCTWTRDKAQTIVGKGKVSYVWTYTGTNTGKWGTSTPATNKKFKFSGQTFMQFTPDGKILHEYDYYDALGFSKQLGWIK